MKYDWKSGQESKGDKGFSGTDLFRQMREMMGQCMESPTPPADCAAMMEHMKEAFRREGKGDNPDLLEILKGMNMESCCGPAGGKSGSE